MPQKVGSQHAAPSSTRAVKQQNASSPKIEKQKRRSHNAEIAKNQIINSGLRDLYGKHDDELDNKKLVNISVDLINEEELANDSDERHDGDSGEGNLIRINEQSKWFEVARDQSVNDGDRL